MTTGMFGGGLAGGITGGAIAVALDLNTGAFYKELRKAEAEATSFRKGFSAYGDMAVSIGKRWTMGLTAPILAGFGSMAKAAIDYESAFAGVRKTTDASEAEFAKLYQGFRDLSKEIPITAAAFASIGEAAGQLGIGIDHIESFSKVMANLGVATNMSAEDAATSLARLANITGMSHDHFDRLGSVVVDLGNNLATTESEIVEMGLRLAAAGTQVGMTEAEILSFAGALSSVGIEAQAGGTAFSKVMIEMQLAVETGSEKLEQFAEIANMSSEEFSIAFKENAPQAIMAFVGGLQDVERNGDSAIKILDDMEIKEVRLRDSLLRASNAQGVFNDALETGTRAWEENTALTKEAEERYKTTESQIQLAKNRVTDIAIELGENLLPHINTALGYIADLTEKFSELSEEEQASILKKAGLVAAIGPLLMIFGNLSKGVGGVIGLFQSFGKVAGPMATTTLPQAAQGAGLLTKAFGAMTSPIGLATVAIGGIAVATYQWAKGVAEAEERTAKWGETVSEETAKMLDTFLDHSMSATTELEKMYIRGEVVTAENTAKIIQHYDEMKESVIGKVEEQEEEIVRILRQGGSDELELAHEHFEEKKRYTQDKHDEIREIIAKAERENRELSEAEKRHLNIRTKQLTDEGIKIISDGEVAVEKLLMQSSGKKSVINKEYMDKVREASKEMGQELIANAEKSYEEQIRYALQLEAEGTESSRKLAEEIKKSAESARDAEIQAADEKMRKVVERLNQQAGETVAIYDAKNKTIMTLEDVANAEGMRRLIKTGDSQEDIYRKYAEKIGAVYDEKTKTIISKEEAARRAMEDTSKTAQTHSDTAKKSYSDMSKGIRDSVQEAIDWLDRYNAKQLQNKSSTISVSHITTHFTRQGTKSMYATGTAASRGGMALVGEQGPELIHLPQGTRVDTAGKTKELMKIDYELLGEKVAEAIKNADIKVNSYLSGRDVTDVVSGELARRVNAY